MKVKYELLTIFIFGVCVAHSRHISTIMSHMIAQCNGNAMAQQKRKFDEFFDQMQTISQKICIIYYCQVNRLKIVTTDSTGSTTIT